MAVVQDEAVEEARNPSGEPGGRELGDLCGKPIRGEISGLSALCVRLSDHGGCCEPFFFDTYDSATGPGPTPKNEP